MGRAGPNQCPGEYCSTLRPASVFHFDVYDGDDTGFPGNVWRRRIVLSSKFHDEPYGLWIAGPLPGTIETEDGRELDKGPDDDDIVTFPAAGCRWKNLRLCMRRADLAKFPCKRFVSGHVHRWGYARYDVFERDIMEKQDPVDSWKATFDAMTFDDDDDDDNDDDDQQRLLCSDDDEDRYDDPGVEIIDAYFTRYEVALPAIVGLYSNMQAR